MSVFSTENQMEEMRQILYNYSKLPFSTGSIPGMLMESALAHAHGGVVLNTYDFVDVVDPGSRCGWQVKSTKAQTPITWKRAKIGDAPRLIDESRRSQGGLQRLGNTIIEFYNAHARESLDKYGLNEIGYARLILARDGTATYYERLLCDKDNPDIFDPSDFRWSWSTPKVTRRKEQLPALQGIHALSSKKWWAWHGLGENQLHFTGESEWWPDGAAPNTFSFQMPSDKEKLSVNQFIDLLKLDA